MTTKSTEACGYLRVFLPVECPDHKVTCLQQINARRKAKSYENYFLRVAKVDLRRLQTFRSESEVPRRGQREHGCMG